MICPHCTVAIPWYIQVLLVLTAILIALSINQLIKLLGYRSCRKRSVIRWAFASLLFFLFAVNVYHSALRVQEEKTLFERRRVYIENATFPSLTFCPTSLDPQSFLYVS